MEKYADFADNTESSFSSGGIWSEDSFLFKKGNGRNLCQRTGGRFSSVQERAESEVPLEKPPRLWKNPDGIMVQYRKEIWVRKID